uniref:Cytochrome P450 n=1 Tax=Salix viminalis TaxID=40686 RepID=A0A6N2NEE6_SALVM
MDQTSLTKVFDLFSPQFLLLLPLVFFILKYISSPSSKNQSLPPGPKPWPVLGNLLHLGKKPHISMASFATTHGPLISLKLGKQLLVVGSSKRAATEILKSHDRLLSARYVSKAALFESHVLDRIAIVWATQCSDGWKSLRALCRNELFSATAIESQAVLREKKMEEMVEFIGRREGEVVRIGEVVLAIVFNTIANLIFSVDLIGLEDDGAATGLKSLMWRMMKLGATPNIADFYPILGGIDLQGLKRKMAVCVNQMFGVWGKHIKERREKHAQDGPRRDFLDVFLANGFEDLQINWVAMELLAAGTDTTATTVEWAMAELLKNKQILERVSEEIKREMDTNSLKESRISQLPYLNACVKETLRLHPPVPFLIPRRALENCEVMGYTIPKDSEVIVNVWAVGRDPSLWEDPLSFKPERFLGSGLDFKGHDYEFLPFGAGRRICPGLTMAARQVHLIIASLLYHFDWSLPNGEDPAMLDMSEKFGITLQKEHPLLVVPRRRI